MAGVRDVLAQALELPVEQRAKIAAALIRSLDEAAPEDPEEVADAWGEEIARRAEALRSGRVRAVPWSTAKKELDRTLRAVRSPKRGARTRSR